MVIFIFLVLENLKLEASISLKFFFLLKILSESLSNPLPIITSRNNLFSSIAKFFVTLKFKSTIPPKALIGSHA